MPNFLGRLVLKAVSYVLAQHWQELEGTIARQFLNDMSTRRNSLPRPARGDEQPLERRMAVHDEIALGRVSIPAKTSL